MRSQSLVCLLLAGLAYGQAAQPATPPAAGAKAEQGASTAPAKAPEVKVGPDDTVITITGFCADSTLQGDACKTTITRAQFEKLADALQPGMSPAIRRQLATAYTRMVRMASVAEKRGLDKDPKFDEMMVYARMQILSQELGRALQDDSGKVSDSDIEDYYKKNEASYQQATMARIFVPRSKQIVNPPAASDKPDAKPSAPVPPTEEQKKAAEEAMKQVATDIHERAVKGEDPDKLQKEVFVAAGLPNNVTTTKMENVRRNTLPAGHQAIMDLKPGAVSDVISDANGPYYIYKMVSVETLPLEKVKPEIRNLISSQRYRDSMAGFQGNFELNDTYFGAAARGPSTPPIPRGARPPIRPSQDPDKD
jgi:hypothetical protein